MKSRETLIRLKKFQVDEKRRRVAQIEGMIADFQRMSVDLEREIQVEQERAGINDPSHFAYPTYAKAAIQRRENLTRSADELRIQLEDAKALLAEAFEELKKVELLDERDQARERAEENAREQADMDSHRVDARAPRRHRLTHRPPAGPSEEPGPRKVRVFLCPQAGHLVDRPATDYARTHLGWTSGNRRGEARFGGRMLTPAELVWLIAAVAKGDEAAFERLYAATRAKLFGVVLRILRRQDLAEEVIQEAYVKIWNNAGQFNPALASPITWMTSIARNRAIDVVRKKSETSIEEEPSAMEVAAEVPDPLARREMTEELKRLLECVGRLEPERQKLVLLAYYNGWSREQLAVKFETPVNTVKTWLRRSMMEIRECLGL